MHKSRLAWAGIVALSLWTATVYAHPRSGMGPMGPGGWPTPPRTASGPSQESFNASRVREPFQASFQAGQRDEHGQELLGTELINMVPFHDKLYAGTGVWEDPDPASGPQILVLDSPTGQWRLEHAFSEKLPDGVSRFRRLTALRAVTFTTDAKGKALNPPVSLLIAGLEAYGDLHGGRRAVGAVYSRDDRTGEWTETSLPIRSIRALHLYKDPVTGVDLIFAGGIGPRIPDGKRRGAIFTGVYDPTAAGSIRWSTEFSGFKYRVMAFAECNGKLYFSAKGDLYERTTNGTHPSWQKVYSNSHPLGERNSGLRGLTTVADPEGSGKEVILAGLEGIPGLILRINPNKGYTAKVELDITEYLSQHWGKLRVPYVIAAYNDMLRVQSPRSGQRVYLIGLQAHCPLPGHGRSAWYLVRDEKARYSLHEIRPIKHGAEEKPKLVAVRAITVSPFAQEAGSILYFGGYDASHRTTHNSAWLYRVGLDTALGGD